LRGVYLSGVDCRSQRRAGNARELDGRSNFPTLAQSKDSWRVPAPIRIRIRICRPGRNADALLVGRRGRKRPRQLREVRSPDWKDIGGWDVPAQSVRSLRHPWKRVAVDGRLLVDDAAKDSG